ncbi:IS110 family transposase [Pseudoduganella sp.]|uniref:IS110 family transposase n=1 Tax=Pseudoduganella sp. TaxID=1880898 RepID=UPI0035B481E9
MNTPVVGIDVSKRKLDVALFVDGKIKAKVVPNSPDGFTDLEGWLIKQKIDLSRTHVCLESTGIYSEPVALFWFDRNIKVSLVNPNCIKSFGNSENLRNKNDQIDAGLIARYCAAMAPPSWQAPPREQRQLRAWSNRLIALQDMRQQEMNRLEVHEVAEQHEVISHVRDHIKWLDAQIAQIESDIDDHIDRHPGLKRDAELIESIPGLGRTTAAKILGHIGDVRRFESAKAFAAFIGVTPRQRQSGSSVHGRTMMCRMGNSQLRAALFLPSLVAKRCNPILRTFAHRLEANGLAKMAVAGALMRKLAHQVYGVVRSGKPFDPNFLEKGLAIQDGI